MAQSIVAYVDSQLDGWLPNILADRGFTIVKSLTFVLGMQIFTSEVFPTNAHGSGFGLAQSGGRLGAVVAFYGIGILSTYGLGYVMTIIGVLLAIAAYAVTQISTETKGLARDAIAPPTR